MLRILLIEDTVDDEEELRKELARGDHEWTIVRIEIADEIRAAIALTRTGTGNFVFKGDMRRLESIVRDLDETKDHALAMIGHELRNPLAPIVTALELLRMRGADSDREIGVIRRNVEHMQRLVDDLLDVARITRGDFTLRRGRVDLADVVARALEMAGPLLEQKHHHVEIDSRSVFVDGDRDRLAQVVSNLLTNAAKYTPTGGHIAVRLGSEAKYALVTVEDDGAGIDPAIQPFVFDAFVQGSPAGNHGREQGGLGLGLAIVKSLVEQHGGTIRVESAPEHGTKLTVRLPLAPSTELVATPAGSLELLPPSPDQRVLVVDDNVDAANLLAEFLGGLGYTTCVAHDGPSALQMAAQERPTMVLLDIGLPVMDGYELGALLKRDHHDLRMIAITGYGDATDRRRSEQAGFEAHLVKPIDLQRLVSALRS